MGNEPKQQESYSKKPVSIESVLGHVEKVSEYIHSGRFEAAGYLIDALPNEFPKDALYGGMAFGLTRMAEKAQSEDKGAAGLVMKMAQSYASKCQYLPKGGVSNVINEAGSYDGKSGGAVAETDSTGSS